MGLFKKIEQTLFTGKIIKDYSIISERQLPLGKIRQQVLLVERQHEKRIVIKESTGLFAGSSVRYFEFDRAGVHKLRSALEDAAGYL